MENSPFSLTGKKVLVTGASSGIGKAIAIEVSKMGAKVIVTGRNRERLEDCYRSLSGNDHHRVLADLTKGEERDSLIESLPAIDGLVNSAGIVDVLPFRFLTEQKLDNVMKANFYSSALLAQGVIKKKVLSDGGSIVFIASLSGPRKAVLGNSVYSASKSAICGLAKNIALELAPRKIRVNTILPGMIETPILENSPISEEDLKKNLARYPLGRYGRPEEVAYLAVYLLSDASVWMTGSELLLDGGFTL